MTPLRPALAVLWLLLAAPLAAQQSPVVVELYTSQGCSSCPPADALLQELTRRHDVLPLALHVDYWDYIGWKDEYADPAYGVRQKGYARVAGRKMVYTPQMIVNGQDDVVGTHKAELSGLIARHRAAAPLADLRATRTGADLMVRVTPAKGAPKGPFDVHLVRYTPLRHADIKRGENAGKRIDYANVVDGWTVLGRWDGKGPAEFTARITGDRSTAVLVQGRDHGVIVAAARVE